MQPEARTTLHEALNRGSRRLQLIAAAQGACIGLVIAILLTAAAWWNGWPALVVGVASAVIAFAAAAVRRDVSRGHSGARVAAMIERRSPHHNVIVTAAELADTQPGSRHYVTDRVLSDAARAASGVDLRHVFPLARTAATLAGLTLLWSVTIAGVVLRPADVPLSSIVAAATASARIGAVDVTVTPPAYMHRAVMRLHDPARIDAPAGSTIEVRVTSAAHRVAAELVEGAIPLAAAGRNVHAATFTAASDGYVAIETSDSAGDPADRRMIGLTVKPDRSPNVWIGTPGRDLHLSDSTKSVDITIDADDDNALSTLTLRYTRVSGSGEQYKFTEGTIPVTISHRDGRTWTARGTLRLAEHALSKGDMIVYRAAASDARPGATPSLSDAYIVEIIAPGSERIAGFAADDETDRYALSQEMVIQKTEKLIRRAASMEPDSVTYQAMQLAAEQRSVRAEFVFMMGGELAEEVIDAADAAELHEEAEAAGEAEIAAGRGANKSRIALVDAIRNMSQANTALTAFDLAGGLAAEKRALKSLQAAFSHTRYILRGLTQHEQLDLARRLTGELAAAQGDARPGANPAESPRSAALRGALASAAELSSATKPRNDAARRAAALSATVARIDPSSQEIARAASLLNDAAAAMIQGEPDDARARMRDAAAVIASSLRAPSPHPQIGTRPIDLDRLDGALQDALRRARRP